MGGYMIRPAEQINSMGLLHEDVNVRFARMDDLPELERIERSCFKTERYPRDVLKAMLRGEGFLTFIAEEDDEAIAAVTLLYRPDNESVQLVSVAVVPEHRKKGIATSLLRIVEDAALKKGARKVALEVSVINVSAVNLYLRNGYLNRGIIKGYYGPAKDAYYMEKRLDDR